VKTLIAYATKHGATARCARLLAEKLPDGADLVDLGVGPGPVLEGYDTVLIGGPIYAGRIRPVVRRFCERSRSGLLGRRVGIFVCCLYTGAQALQQLSDAFPPWLAGHAFASRALGGAVRLAELGPVEGFVFRKVARMGEDLERIDTAAIAELAAAAARA
jgi:menaquinone-dependent protoporphyrinogen oxidase